MNASAPAALSARGRRTRAVVTFVVFGLLVAGTLWGDDVHFPFGPFRMYATTEPRNGVVDTYVVDVRPAGAAMAEVAPEALGLRRAELEGRVAQLVAEPALLAQLVEAYEQRHPQVPRLAELDVVRRRRRLQGGGLVGAPVDQVVVAWTR